MAISVSFPFSWAAQPVDWGPASLGAGFIYRILFLIRLIPNWLIGGLRAPSAGCWLSLPHLNSNWSGLQTAWLPVFTELYNSSTPTLWASQILIFLDRMHMLFTQVHFLFWQPGRVVGQYATLLWNLPLLHVRCSIADNSRLCSQDAWFSFPLLLWMIDCYSVEVLVDPVLYPFTCLGHTFLKCTISPQLKRSLASGQFFRPFSPSGWDISLHPLHMLSLKILGVPSSCDHFSSDLTEPNVGGTRLFRR